ncbi:hypothetical protein ACVIW2_008097 [Bradyrhizobium huanghuaihaiense]
MSIEMMIEQAVELANAFRETLSAAPAKKRLAMVKRRFSDSDVVFAIWQDPNLPHGVGWILVKGQQIARQVLANNENSIRVAAIPCIEAAQAHALLQELGERDMRH